MDVRWVPAVAKLHAHSGSEGAVLHSSSSKLQYDCNYLAAATMAAAVVMVSGCDEIVVVVKKVYE